MDEAVTADANELNEKGSLLLKCEHCGVIRPAQESGDGLIPRNSAAGDECDECGNTGFVQLVL